MGKLLITQFQEYAGADAEMDQIEFCKCFKKCFPNVPGSEAGMLFDAADTSGDGKLDLKEFLSIITMTSKGTAEQKLEMMFRTYDADNSGTLEQDEFSAMLYASLTCDE